MDIADLSALAIVAVSVAAAGLLGCLVRRWSRLAHERRRRDAVRRGELDRAGWQ